MFMGMFYVHVFLIKLLVHLWFVFVTKSSHILSLVTITSNIKVFLCVK